MTHENIGATFTAHSALLMALVLTHPDRGALLAVFSQQMQQVMDALAEDSAISGILLSFEENLRRIIGA